MRNFRSTLIAAAALLVLMLTSCDDKSKDPTNPVITTPFKFTEGFVDQVEHPTSIDVSNWMAKLDDNTKVCKLSIPGTHDALTGMGFYDPVLKCMFNVTALSQVSTLEQQLQHGVRFFDIRPIVSVDTVAHARVLRCTHGMSELDITFERALDIISGFLKTHPGEFCIVKIQHDNGTEDQISWVPMMLELMAKSKYDDMFADWKPDLRVGEMRGKVLFFNRVSVDGLVGAKCPWPDEDPDVDENVYYDQERSRTIESCYDSSVKSTLWVQDYYKVTTKQRQDTKVAAVLKMLDDARTVTSVPDDNTWIVNHCSAYTFPSAQGYVENAQVVHPRVIENLLFNTGTVGIVAMDFSCYDNVHVIVNGGTPYTSLYLYGNKPCSQSMINLLIESNFK